MTTKTEYLLTAVTPTNSDYLGNLNNGHNVSGDGSTIAAWEQVQKKLLVSRYPFTSSVELTLTGATQPFKVSLSYDGSVIAIGENSYSSNAGRVWIRYGTDWGTEVVKTGGASAYLGYSVRVTNDGTKVVAIAPGDTTRKGAIFVWSGSGYGTQNKVVPTQAADSNLWAWTFAMTPDASTIAAGRIYQNNGGTYRGALFVYSGTTWGTETVLTQANPVDYDYLGETVAISDDGSVIASGGGASWSATGNRGRAWIFSGTNWTTQTKLIPSDDADLNKYGNYQIWLAPNGDTLMVSASGPTNTGKLYIHHGANWATETVLSPGATNYYYTYTTSGDGFDVAPDGMGGYVIVGGAGNANRAYLTYGQNWETTETLTGTLTTPVGLGISAYIKRVGGVYKVAASAPSTALGGTARGAFFYWDVTGIEWGFHAHLDAQIASWGSWAPTVWSNPVGPATITGSFTLNAEIKLDTTHTFTVQAILRKTMASPTGFTVDAQVSGTRVASFSLNAVIRKTVLNGTDIYEHKASSTLFTSGSHTWTNYTQLLQGPWQDPGWGNSTSGRVGVGWLSAYSRYAAWQSFLYFPPLPSRPGTIDAVTLRTSFYETSNTVVDFTLEARVYDWYNSPLNPGWFVNEYLYAGDLEGYALAATRDTSTLSDGWANWTDVSLAGSYTWGSDLYLGMFSSRFRTYAGAPDATHPEYIGIRSPVESSGTTSPRLWITYHTGTGFTLDAEITEVPGGNFTLDALLLKVAADDFTLDAWVIRHVVPTPFTLDAWVIRHVVPTPFTLDAILRKPAGGDFTLDAEIQSVGVGVFTLAAILRRTMAPTPFTVDAWLSRTSIGDFTLDAIYRDEQEGVFALDAELIPSNPRFFANAVIFKPGIRDSFVLSAFIARNTFTLDAHIQAGGTITLDALVVGPRSGSLRLDAWISSAGTRVFGRTIDAILRAHQAGSFTARAELRLPFVTRTGSAPVDAVCLEAFTSSFAVDAEIESGHRTRSFAIDADIRGQLEKRGSFTVSAILRRGVSSQVVLEAWIGGNAFFRLDANIAGAILVDAWIVAPTPGSFTVSAWLAGRITLNAVIRKTASSHFHVDAEIKSASDKRGSFTLNALVNAHQSGQPPIWLDAIIVGTSPGHAFTVDAFVQPYFTLDAWIARADGGKWGGLFSLDAYIKGNAVIVWPDDGGPAVDGEGNPWPDWFKASRKYRINITLDGTDITGDVIWSQTTFTQNAKTNPGTFTLTLEGEYAYDGGEVILVNIDDYRAFGGIVLTVERSYPFVAAGGPITILRGADFNVLFDKLIVYNKASADDPQGSYTDWKAFAKGSLDTRIINKVFSSYVDLPAGFNYTMYVESVGVAAPEKPWVMPTSGSPLRQVMQSISQVTNAVWWIDPYLYLHYGSRTTVTAPFPITDGLGGVSSQNISMSEDISKLVTEAMLWGTLSYTVEGEIMAAHRTSGDYASLGPWQYGEFRSDLHHQAFINRRIDSIIERYGQPIKRAKVTIFEPGFQAGQVADVRLTAHGLEAPLVIRELALTFAVSKGLIDGHYYGVPRYDLTIGLDPEEPWDIYDYLPWPDDKGTPYDPRHKHDDWSGDCFYYCFYEDFERPPQSGWGTTLTDQRWTTEASNGWWYQPPTGPVEIIEGGLGRLASFPAEQYDFEYASWVNAANRQSWATVYTMPCEPAPEDGSTIFTFRFKVTNELTWPEPEYDPWYSDGSLNEVGIWQESPDSPGFWASYFPSGWGLVGNGYPKLDWLEFKFHDETFPYIQMIKLNRAGTDDPTGGTWDLEFSGHVWTGLAYDITPATLQDLMRADLESGNVNVTSDQAFGYTVTFTGTLESNEVLMTADATNLTVAPCTIAISPAVNFGGYSSNKLVVAYDPMWPNSDDPKPWSFSKLRYGSTAWYWTPGRARGGGGEWMNLKVYIRPRGEMDVKMWPGAETNEPPYYVASYWEQSYAPDPISIKGFSITAKRRLATDEPWQHPHVQANEVLIDFDTISIGYEVECDSPADGSTGAVGDGWNSETVKVTGNVFVTQARIVKGTLQVYDDTGTFLSPDLWTIQSDRQHVRLEHASTVVTAVYRAYIENLRHEYSTPRITDASTGRQYLP